MISLLPLFLLLPLALSSPIFGAVSSRSSPATNSISPRVLSSSFSRAAKFGRIAYCSSAVVTKLTCGAPCKSLGSGVTVLQTGGDGGSVPLYFVAHDPVTQSIVVAHQGTDPNKILSIANDAKFLLTNLNTTLFPQATGKSIKVHGGFQQTFARTSGAILASVRAGLRSKKVNKVIVTGHSLGAAIATMDAVMLKQNLSPPVAITTTVFGLPRGGNSAWATFVDSNLGKSFTHITNQHDPVPTVPPQLLGFQHPQGEVYIKSVDVNGNAISVLSCPGKENPSCSNSNSVTDASVANHLGPYFDNISFGSNACPL